MPDSAAKGCERVIVVTGGAGFIGSNLVHALNARGRVDLGVVDYTALGPEAPNLVGADVVEAIDPWAFLDRIERAGGLDGVDAVLHQGARTSTLDDDRAGVMRDNFEWSCRVLERCRATGTPLVYASSAAVYGTNPASSEDGGAESPLNLYGESKYRFDLVVRDALATPGSQVVGLRYFNVYGPREDHKGAMSSIVAQLDAQVSSGATARLFGAGCGVGAGQHRRDFVHVDDVVDVVLWFLDHPGVSGIFNCGTGRSRSFNEVAAEVIAFNGGGEIEYSPFPPHLADRYQPNTCADLARLRAVGYDREFAPIEDGVGRYLRWRRAAVA